MSAVLPKLYQYAVCPFCCKVKAILSYKKIDYESVEVHPLNKKEISFSKDYRKVPIFIDAQGKQVNDSTPIMRYIDEKYAELPVFERDVERKKLEEQWLKWSDEVLVRALPPLIYKNFSDALKAFDYITQEGKFSWLQQRLIKYSGAGVMKMVAKKSAKSQGIQNPSEHFENCLNIWGDAVGSADFLGGGKPNAADLSVYGILKSIEGMPAFSYILDHSRIFPWFERVEGLTSKG